MHIPKPLKHEPNIEIMRPRERKRMTIAIGLNAGQGLVLAADTEESSGYPGDIKMNGAKMFGSARSNFGALAISGSGSANYIDSAGQKLQKVFLQNQITSLEECREQFEVVIDDFYNRHVLLPYERKSQHFDLIIGITSGKDQRLFLTDQTTMKASNTYLAVGAGSDYAMSLLSRHYRPLASLRQTVLLAAYVIYSVKETIGGCGKYTDIALMGGNRMMFLPRQTSKALERQFEVLAELETSMLHYMFGHPGGDDTATMQGLPDRLHLFRQELLSLLTAAPINQNVIHWGD